MKHMKVLSKAKVIILDTYYLMMGGYQKKKKGKLLFKHGMLPVLLKILV